MFTGIIEEIGLVKSFVRNSVSADLKITAKEILNDLKIGDSVAINGICQTVTNIENNTFEVEISAETLSVTSIENLKSGDEVNLERALTLNSRLGGHIVSGHIDCRAKCVNIEKLSDFYNISFEIPKEQVKYIVYKGSITVNGISLTVADIKDNIFKVAVIPHTYENTNLRNIKNDDFVNIETDILGKYIEKLVCTNDNNGISMNFLQENGFV